MSGSRGATAPGSHEPRRYPVKLVRDGVAKYLDGSLTYEPTENREEYIRLLRAKLVEEAVEYIQDPSLSELGDVLEVVRALAENDLGSSLTDVLRFAERKFLDRGGFTGPAFDSGTVMVVRTTAPENFTGANEPRGGSPASSVTDSPSPDTGGENSE